MVATTAPTIQVAAPAADTVPSPSAGRSGQRLVSLRLKLGILLGTVAALAVAIPTILHAIAFVSDQERRVGEDNLELARVVGALIEGRIDQTFVLLDFMTSASGIVGDIKAGDAARLTDRLNRVVRLDDALSSILVVDRDGVVMAHSMVDKRLVGQSALEWPHVQQVLDGAAHTLGSAIVSPVTDRAVVPFAVPIHAPDGEILGAAVAFLSLDRLESHVNGARGPGRGLARIVDGNGRLLTSSAPTLQLEKVSGDQSVLSEALRGTPSLGRVQSTTGGPVYAAAIPLANGWAVEVQHPVESVLGPVREVLVRSCLFAVVAFALAMLVGAVASRRITEPLSALVRAIRSIRREEGRPVLPHSSTAEVAWLADELEAMRSVLEGRTAEMRGALDTLARYRLLAERTTDIVLFVNAERTIIDVNRAAELAYGYTRSELIGFPAPSLVAEPARPLSDDQFARARQDGLRLETIHRRKDGTTFPVEATMIGTGRADPTSDTTVMSIVRDIGPRRQAEAALRASEARYRTVVETIREVVFQVDSDDRWTFLNPAWTEITEYPVQETLGRQASETLHPDDRERARTLYRSLVRQRTSVARFEARYLTRSGGTRWLEIYANLSFGPDGGYLGASGTLSDVTDRRQVEAARERVLVRDQQARASEERAAEITSIVKHMPCGVLVFDTDSCLTLANERALEMLSPYPPGDDEGSGGRFAPPPSALLDERLLNPYRVLVARALGGSVVSDRELVVDGPDGGGRVLVGSAVPLRSANGDVRGAVAILTDVSRERRLMENLVQSEGTLRHSLESLLVLHEASRALGSTLLEEEIGRRLVEGCVRIARLDAALVFAADDHGGARLLGAHGDPVLIEHVLACRAEQQAREDVLTQPSSAGVSVVRSCAELSLTTGHHVELAARGRTLGVLEIYGTEQRAAVTDDALASLAAHAVSAFENARLYREVGDREQRLQDALRQLLIAQEEERRRVAYELHDGLAQVAAATHLSLQTFASQYRTRSAQKQHQLDRSVDLARRVVREARQVIAGLRPTILDDFGLERALRLHVHELENDGWTIVYEPQIGPERLPGPIETVLYRIAQEALTNVRKHALTLSATVRLRRHDGRVELEVVDQGVGFGETPPAADAEPGHRLGLVGMRERAALVGGCCLIESEPGQGTRVVVTIPLPAVPLPGEAALVAAGVQNANER